MRCSFALSSRTQPLMHSQLPMPLPPHKKHKVDNPVEQSDPLFQQTLPFLENKYQNLLLYLKQLSLVYLYFLKYRDGYIQWIMMQT